MVRSAILETGQTEKKEGRILVIDKDLNFVNELEPKLKQAGYEVLFSPTPEEGLKAARKHHPDIILLDFLTSHEDSHASISIISHDESLQGIPLFILAPQSLMARVNQRMANLEKFITKPVNYILLLDTLQRSLEMRKA
jgi:DNA-binding response OmpR family regulator